MSPRNEEQNKLIRDERKDQILQAALRVFAKKGLSATKISDIASAAGLSHGLVYHYFSSKDEIFYYLVKYAIETSSNAPVEASKIPGNALDKLTWMTDTVLRQMVMHEDSVYFFLIMTQALTYEHVPESVKDLTSSASLMMEHLVPIIAEGQKEGIIVEGNPKILSVTYWAFIQGLAVTYAESGRKFPLPSSSLILRTFKA